jgi:hypothetical protein
MTRVWLVSLCAVSALGGCSFDGWVPDEDDGTAFGAGPARIGGTEGWSDEGEALDVRRATLEGSLGDVRGFSGDTWRTVGTYAEWGSSLDLRSRTAAGVAMVRLDVWGDLATLEPGRRYVYSAFAWEEPTTTGQPAVQMSGINCSGPENDAWDYDVPADEVVVDCVEGPEEGTVQLDFTVALSDEPILSLGPTAPGGEVRGSVVYAIPTAH